jgi:hypothetical protein
MVVQITSMIVRTYGDTGAKRVYVEWIDDNGETGRTEGEVDNTHMRALIARGGLMGVPLVIETWSDPCS